MVTIKDIDTVMTAVCPKTLSESWDNDGVMLCSDVNKAVSKALVMLEVTPNGAAYACEYGYDLIVTHHPLIFNRLDRLTGHTFSLFESLIKKGVSVLSYHTRLDSAQNGVNDVAMELLGLSDVRPFGGENGACGRIGVLLKPMFPCEFALKLKTVFGISDIRASMFLSSDRKIKTVAFVGGAGKSFFDQAYAVGADAFVTGEAAHNTFLDCKELDVCLFDIGHYYSENPVCTRIKKILDDSFSGKISVDVYDVGSPFSVL